MGWTALAHLRWHAFIGVCWHDGIIIAAPPVPAPKLPHVTFNVLNGLFLGSLPSDAKEGQLMGPGGIALMGRTTDAGFITPHVSIPPNNLLLPLTILLGGSESMLGSSSVKLQCTNLIWGTDEYDIAACTIPVIPLSTNFGCNDPLFVPLDFVVSPNTVQVGVTLADLLTMAIDLVIAALLEGVMALGSKGVSKAWGKVKAKKAATKMAKVSKAGEAAYQKALKEADLDAALKDGLMKRRAPVMGTPAPPPKPRRVLEKAQAAGDEAWRRAFKEEFGTEVSRRWRDFLMGRRPEAVGRLSAVVRTGIKAVVEEVITIGAGETIDNQAEAQGLRATPCAAQIQAGEAVLAAAGG
jgi:hypothetical protein